MTNDEVETFIEVDLAEYVHADRVAVLLDDPAAKLEGQRVWAGARSGPYRLGVFTHVSGGVADLELVEPPVWYDGEPPDIVR